MRRGTFDNALHALKTFCIIVWRLRIWDFSESIINSIFFLAWFDSQLAAKELLFWIRFSRFMQMYKWKKINSFAWSNKKAAEIPKAFASLLLPIFLISLFTNWILHCAKFYLYLRDSDEISVSISSLSSYIVKIDWKCNVSFAVLLCMLLAHKITRSQQYTPDTLETGSVSS